MFRLTATFQDIHGTVRIFEQPSLPRLEGWDHLLDLLLTACLRIHRDPQYDAPTEFHVYGSVKEFDAKPWKEATRVLEMRVKLNPLLEQVKVGAAWFHESLREVQEDMDLAYGRPLLSPTRREQLIRPDIEIEFDVLRSRPMPEPQYPEFRTIEANSWRHRLVNEHKPKRLREEEAYLYEG